MLATLAIYAVILVVFYVLVLLPQQRRQKAARQLNASLSIGDEVILESGIHGFVSEIEDTVVWVEVAPDIDLKVVRSAIATRVNPEIEEKSTPDKQGSVIRDSDES